MKKILLFVAAVMTAVSVNAKVVDFTTMASSIEDWTIEDATLNQNETQTSSNKYAYDASANIVCKAYVTNEPDVVFQYKNSSDKTKAIVVYPGSRFEFSGKNGVVIIKNTNVGDTLVLRVASKGSTGADFIDPNMTYPKNAAAISDNLTLPAKNGDYAWQDIEYVSNGGDVEIKEVGGGYTIKAIYIAERPQEITVRVKVPATITNPYIYAWDNNANYILGGDGVVPLRPLGNNQYYYTFDATISTANIAFYDSNSGRETTSFLNVVSSKCYNIPGTYTGNTLDCTEVDCADFGQPAPKDTVTIRLNPYSFDWVNAYLYVWYGSSYYSNYGTAKLINGRKMKLAADGWWTYSFLVDNGLSFYVGFGDEQNTSPDYYDGNNTYSSSTCFEYNGSLQSVVYKQLTPDESTTFAVHVTTPGTFGQVLVQALGNKTWTDVLALTVTGTLNDADMQYLGRMTNLQILDLSGTDITSIGGCNDLAKLQSVTLPATCIAINNSAFYGCKRLGSINLSNIQTIGDYAFYQCQNLSSLTLPNVLSVGNHAFAMYDDYYSSYTSILETVTMPMVQSIGDYAFNSNQNLASITMPLVTSIGQYAFCNCYALAQVDLSNVTSLGEGAFYMYGTRQYVNGQYVTVGGNLQSITLSDELEIIPYQCFNGCDKLTAIDLPSSLKSIGNNALPYLVSVQLPEGLLTVGRDNFQNATSISIPSTVTKWGSYSTSWQEVYSYPVVPQTFSIFNNDNVASATLYVPSISLAAYKLHDNWYKFGTILPMDGNVDKFVINDEFTVLTTAGIANKADIVVNSPGMLMLSAPNTLSAGNYIQQIGAMPYYYGHSTLMNYIDNESHYYLYVSHTSMLLANSPMTADAVAVKLVPKANQWNFFSLPFDVNMADITIGTDGLGNAGTSQWVIREYSGANRASGNGDTWNNVPANGVLQANKGYILYWVVENSSNYQNNDGNYYTGVDNLLYYFNMPAVNNANKQKIFATNDVAVPLTEYSAEFPQNQSWNLVGNPYPCSFDIHQMDYDAPITVWNGMGYVAYTSADDNYSLRPAEAFFVQAPQGVNQISFHKEGRSAEIFRVVTEDEIHGYYGNNWYYYAPRRANTNSVLRKVFNFTLSNADYSDRARLVLNENASADYELTRDAAKMLSTDKTVPQLYLSDNGIRYAINERPEGNGVFYMSAFFGKSGEYSIKVQSDEVQSTSIILTDTQTNVATDLSEGGYTFTTEGGTFDNRFIISMVSKMPTGVGQVPSDQVQSTKMLRDGRLIIIRNGIEYNVNGQMTK